ncbi:MAG: iron hydrogenase [Candidatus Pacebacteria bacterium]|nr:iron hydrogenase [Candidatus Paceibacterota bacterium]
MQTKIIALNRYQILSLAKFGTLLGVAIIAPLLHQQLITGTIVNAVLFASTIFLGWPAAVTIGVLPSLFALAFGTLPQPLALMIPFIVASNAILVISFYFLKSKGFWLAVLAAAFLKFLFLLAASQLIIKIALNGPIAKSIAQMMSLPQLITALLGGVLVYCALRLSKRPIA